MINSPSTTRDGLQLYTQSWPVENPKAIVLLVHGLCEHIGRYEYVASVLNAAGYAALGQDHRGHGKSEGQPRAYAPSIDTFVDDLELLEEAAAQTYAGKPLFVLGHSMGGLLATRFALRHQDRLRGLVTSGAALLPGAGIPKAVIALGKVAGDFVPKLSLTQINSAWLSHDPAVVSGYDSDPLVYHGKIKVGFGLALLRAGEETLARAGDLTLPMLVMHGESDRIVSAEASRQLHARASSSDKTLIIYDGLYHEIFNEPEKNKVLAEVIRWLDAHC